MRYKNYLLQFVAAIMLLLITGCGDQTVTCIEPDDFGAGYISIASQPGDNNIITVQAPDVTAKTFVPEYSNWIDQGQVTNGEDILLVVRNNYITKKKEDGGGSTVGSCLRNSTTSESFNPSYSWTAWFGTYQLAANQFFFADACTAVDDTSSESCRGWCTKIRPIPNGTTTSNAPCVYTQGAGAFVLLVPLDSTGAPITDPNKSELAGTLPPNATAFHLFPNSTCNNGTTTGIYDAGCPAGGLYLKKKDIPAACMLHGCGLYTKIVDQLYEDNFGSYAVQVKSGFQLSPGYLTRLVIFVQSSLCTATTQIYQNILPYLGYIRLLLVAYVAFSAIGFLIGTIEITQKELLVRIFKMAIVIQIATTGNSWNFFNEYFFSFFTNGISEVVSMFMQEGTSAAPPQGTNSCVQNIGGFVLLDNIIEKFSDTTFQKLIAIAFTDISGFLFFFVFYIVVGIVFYACIMAVFTYLISYTIISILIVLAPIFIPFILFKATKAMFDNWLKNLLSNFIQPIVVLAFAFFVAQLVLNQVYYILGIRVCWTKWSLLSWKKVWDAYRWHPAGVSEVVAKIIPPGRACDQTTCSDMLHCTSNDCSGTYCVDYSCHAVERYVDAPYLDPKDPTDIAKLADIQSGTYVDFSDIAIFALLGWFVWKFIKIIPTIAATLAGTPMNYVNPGQVGQGVLNNVISAGNKTLNFGYTNAKRVWNIGSALFASTPVGQERKGIGSRLEAARVAAYNTEDASLFGDIHKKWTTKIKEPFQDWVGASVETKVANFKSKYENVNATEAWKLIGKGYIKANLKALRFAGRVAATTVDTLTGAARGAVRGFRGEYENKYRDRIVHHGEGFAGKTKAAVMNFASNTSRVMTGIGRGAWRESTTGAANRTMTKYFGEHTGAIPGISEFQPGIFNSGQAPAGSGLVEKAAALGGKAVGKLASISSENIHNTLRTAAADVGPKYKKLEGSKADKVGAAATNVRRFLTSSLLLSGALNSAANLFETNAQAKERKENEENLFEVHVQDKVGGIVGNYMESKAARASHFMHGLTEGAYGTDIHKKQKDDYHYDRTRYEMIEAQHQTNDESNWFPENWAYDPTRFTSYGEHSSAPVRWMKNVPGRLLNTAVSVQSDLLANRKR